MADVNILGLVLLVVVVPLVLASARVVPEYERAVVFRFGRLVGARGPGLIFVAPCAESTRTVDLRVTTLEVQVPPCESRDGATLLVSAMLLYQVIDAERAVDNVSDYASATSQIAESALRDAIGNSDACDWRREGGAIVGGLQHCVDMQTSRYGVGVAAVMLLDSRPFMLRALGPQDAAEMSDRPS